MPDGGRIGQRVGADGIKSARHDAEKAARNRVNEVRAVTRIAPRSPSSLQPSRMKTYAREIPITARARLTSRQAPSRLNAYTRISCSEAYRAGREQAVGGVLSTLPGSTRAQNL